MSRLLAFDWDDLELRVAIATSHGGKAVLQRAFAVRLPPSGDGKAIEPAAVGQALSNALAGESVRRVETLAAIGRSAVELKELSLPPAPDDELPDLVRFQATREFAQLQEDSPLDFIPLSGNDVEHRTVIAAAIPQATLARYHSACQEAELDLKHLVLRSSASASLLSRRHPGHGQARMLVDLLGDEVDLTVLVGDTPIVARTTRLPGESSDPEQCRPVFLEIRRTIAAVQNRLHDQRVDAVYLCGDSPYQAALTEQVKRELNLPVEVFEPFEGFELSGALRRSLPEHRSRFAPLLGMLADAAAGQKHAIDFLDPRRKPEPKSRRREATLAVACAATLVLAFVGWTWYRITGMDNEIRQLSQRSIQLDGDVKKAKALQKEVAEIDAWAASDVPWLDVLYRVSTRAPKAEDALLTQWIAGSEKSKAGGGTLTVHGLVRDKATLNALESQLRSASQFKVSVSEIDSDKKNQRYAWAFKSDVQIPKEAVAAVQKAAAAQAKGKGAGAVKAPAEAKNDGDKPADKTSAKAADAAANSADKAVKADAKDKEKAAATSASETGQENAAASAEKKEGK